MKSYFIAFAVMFLCIPGYSAEKSPAKKSSVAASQVAKTVVQVTKDDAKSFFTTGAVYTITNKAHGQELAMTLVKVPEDPKKGIETSNSSIQLKPIKKGENSQLWQPDISSRAGPNEFSLYSRVNPPEYKDLSFVMKIYKETEEFGDLDNTAYQDKNNFTTAALRVGETREVWIIQKLSNGSFRISSLLGWKAEGRTPIWKEQRSLEAYKGSDGQIRLRHGVTSDAPSQQWTFTKAGYYP